MPTLSDILERRSTPKQEVPDKLEALKKLAEELGYRLVKKTAKKVTKKKK